MDDPELEGQDGDLDIAAAMGFSSFGGTKKRKYDQANSPRARVDASGANSTALGVRPKVVDQSDVQGTEIHSKVPQKPSAATGLADFLARAQTIPDQRPNVPQNDNESNPEMISFGGSPISKAELNALRFGVRNDNGDTAYFLPNFLEDPWDAMKSRR